MRVGGDRRLGVEVSRYAARSATGVVFILDLAVGRGALRHVLLPAWVGAISLVYAAYEIARSPTLGVGLAQRGKEPTRSVPTAPARALASTVEFVKP